MLLRKLVAALCPLLLCVLCCATFRLLDAWLGANSFFAFLVKGLLLGAVLALTLPLAGVHAHTQGLAGWLWGGVGVLAAALLYQYLDAMGLVNVPVLRRLLHANGQIILVEGAVTGHLAACALLYRRG